jgi:hypothetical protein
LEKKMAYSKEVKLYLEKRWPSKTPTTTVTPTREKSNMNYQEDGGGREKRYT